MNKVLTDSSIIDIKSWEAFVQNHPNGNVFQSPYYYFSCLKTPLYKPNIIAVSDEDDSILAILVFVLQKEDLGFLSTFSLRSIVYGGPLVKNGNPELYDFCLRKYEEILKKRAVYTQFRNFSVLPENVQIVFKKNGFLYSDHLNIIQNVSIEINEQWNQFSRSRKKGIKRAQNYGFQFSYSDSINQLDYFYRLLKDTYTRIKLPIPDKSHFEELLNQNKHNNVKIFFINKDDTFIAGLFVLIYKETMYGYYMGSVSRQDVLKEKPLDFLFWEVFKWCKENHLSYFDWLGAGSPSKDYGVRDFKLQFGGEVVNLGRFQKHHKPLLMLISKLGLFIWKHLKRRHF